jgi:nitrite reductase/ring-hydroxylating ferredoxin subunit
MEEKVAKGFMNILQNKINSLLRKFFCLIVLAACTPNDYDDPVPYAPFPDIILNLNLPDRIALRTPGATATVGGGVRGIIIYCKQANEYMAYERNCTFHPNDACATVNIDASKLFLVDPCCGSQFDLATGSPSGGVAIRPLVQYRTTFDGTILTITDEVIN